MDRLSPLASTPPCLRIAILNDGRDTISLLSEWFQLHGHFTVSAAATDLRKDVVQPAKFLQTMQPDVLIFDIGVPYAVNWYFVEMLRMSVPSLPLVMTTGNAEVLERIVGSHTAFELTGTHDNLEELLALVYRASGRL